MALSFGTATREIGRHFQTPLSSRTDSQGQWMTQVPEIRVPICFDIEGGIILEIHKL